MGDLILQGDLALRLLVAAVLGALVGVEREIHDHPAGMRTHLLVAMGSAAFTVLSIYAFPPNRTGSADPARVAAQIVSGIGFLGAGAIIKDGLSIRGLTTAASLWAVAAIGMSAGAAAYGVAAAGTIIVVLSLWPLGAISERLRGGAKVAHVRIQIEKLTALGAASAAFTKHHVEIGGLQTRRLGKGRYQADFELRVRSHSDLVGALEEVGVIPGAELGTTDQAE
jgi:putative Mg2+ transporter-C (MgtC) family protein